MGCYHSMKTAVLCCAVLLCGHAEWHPHMQGWGWQAGGKLLGGNDVSVRQKREESLGQVRVER